jgi:hypothetical protein
MTFKQERPGVWYDRAAVGDAPFKVVFRPDVSTKVVLANGEFRSMGLAEAKTLVVNLCEVVKKDGVACGRNLPCVYHG